MRVSIIIKFENIINVVFMFFCCLNGSYRSNKYFKQLATQGLESLNICRFKNSGNLNSLFFTGSMLLSCIVFTFAFPSFFLI